MAFKNPGGDLVWLTPLLMLAGLYACWTSIRSGATGFALLYGSITLLSLLIWFEVKWAAIPLMIYFVFLILLGIWLLYQQGFSWYSLGKLCMPVLLVYEFWKWHNKPDHL